MKRLVTYFSASGVTKKAAEQLAQAVGADLHEIRPAREYSRADLDWTNSKSRSSVEMNDPASRPELAEEKTDLSGYDRVYVGFPIWWGVAPHAVNTFIENNDLAGKEIVVFATSGGSRLAPHAVNTFIENNDLAGKEIVVFATSGGSRLEPAVRSLQQQYPGLDIKAGKLLHGKVTGDII